MSKKARRGAGPMVLTGRGAAAALLGAVALFLAAGGQAEAGVMAMPGKAMPDVASQVAASGVQKVIFHHRKRADDVYCTDTTYWWFYRPYQTKGENYPRCMPYFHYPAEAYGETPAPDYPMK